MEYKFSNKISGLQPSAIREILKQTSVPGMIPFAAGNPSADSFPKEEVAQIAKEILEKSPVAALQYGISEGFPALREALKAFLKKNQNIGMDEDELLIVSGAQQGIELAAKVFTNDGDKVICENPSFVGALNAFRSYSLGLVGIDIESDGIDIGKLETALKKEKNAKIIYTIPNFQNPSGVTMSLKKREQLYALACTHDLMIIEDNPYGDLRYEGENIPSIKSFDTEGRVIYAGSFSKVISPGLRVGYVVTRKDVSTKITVAKQCSDVHSTLLSQMIIAGFMEKHGLENHIAKIVKIYKKKFDLTMDAFAKHLDGKVEYVKPQGGLFIYCRLPQSIKVSDFCKTALSQMVAVVPGSAFSASDTTASGIADITENYFRINFSAPSDEQLVKGIEILGKILS